MASPELAEIRRIRKKHGITQTELAKLAGVSQSLIAKIETGRVDPTFSHAMRIFEALYGIATKREPKAEDILTKKIISVNKNEPLTEAIRRMRSHSISQMPVIDREKAIGLVSETSIIDRISQGHNPQGLSVQDVMEEAPATIAKTTPAVIVAELLRHSPIVIVAENGKPIGIITKSDVLNRFA